MSDLSACCPPDVLAPTSDELNALFPGAAHPVWDYTPPEPFGCRSDLTPNTWLECCDHTAPNLSGWVPCATATSGVGDTTGGEVDVCDWCETTDCAATDSSSDGGTV